MLIFLAIIQGISEFIPISSTAHIIIIASLFENIYPGAHYIVFLHFGSMFAIIIYFWKDIYAMLLSVLKLGRGEITPHFKLIFHVVLATLPVILVGGVIFEYIKKPQDTPFVIGINSIIFGFLLYICDRQNNNSSRVLFMPFKHSFLIGMAQCFALLPGASRSGTTITAARALGFSRTEAMRFSFLMGIPAILGAGFVKFRKIQWVDMNMDWETFILGGLVSFICSYLVIQFMMSLLRKVSFLPFAVYRILLGCVLLTI